MAAGEECGRLVKAWKTLRAAERELHAIAGLDEFGPRDAQEVFALGLVAQAVGGTADPDTTPWSTAVIAPDGKTIDVEVLGGRGYSLTSGRIAGENGLFDWQALGIDDDDFDDEDDDDDEKLLERDLPKADVHALVVIEGDDVLAIHLIAAENLPLVVQTFGDAAHMPWLQHGRIMNRLMHENIVLEPAVATALGVSTMWFAEEDPQAALWEAA